jgi:hypothetical protein
MNEEGACTTGGGGGVSCLDVDWIY